MMTIVTCENCGYKQELGGKCRKCGSPFAYHEVAGGAAAPAPFPQPGTSAPAYAEPKHPSVFQRVYHVARWVTLTILLLVIVLILHKAPTPQVRFDPEAAARLSAKLGQLQAAPQTGPPHELRLDQDELNTFLASNLALKLDGGAATRLTPAPPEAGPSLQEVQSSVRDVKITMAEDRVQAYVVFDFHGKDLSLILQGRLHVANGYLRFEPVSGKLGSLPLPQSTLESAVSRMFDSPENREKLRVPPEISDIRIDNGELLVAYR
jgi:hypothetical protein